MDGGPVISSVNYSASIGVGASVTINGAGIWTATAGTHAITAVVDDLNTIKESNENNNTYTLTKAVSDVWYNMELEDEEGNKLADVYLTDIGDTSEAANSIVTAIVRKGTDTSWKQYALRNGAWSGTTIVYASDPILSGNVSYASTNDVNMSSFTIKKININQLKNDVMNKVFQKIGVTTDGFEPDDIDYFLQGIKVGIDDNVSFGLQQALFGLQTAYDECFFCAGKIVTDAAFLTYYSGIAGVSGGAAVYLFAQAEVTATVVAMVPGTTHRHLLAHKVKLDSSNPGRKTLGVFYLGPFKMTFDFDQVSWIASMKHMSNP